MDPTASMTKWWRLAIYFAAAVVLAVFAISFTMHSTSKEEERLPSSGLRTSFSLNASSALHRAGFNGMAALLSISPEYYASASPNVTIFALSDSALGNISFPPWLMKDFFRYHALPLRLQISDLAEQPQGTCLPTLSPGKNLVITRSGAGGNRVEINDVQVTDPQLFLERVEINDVQVTDPQLFLEGRVVIHGIRKPFAFLGPQEISKNWGLLRLPQCDSNLKAISEVMESKKPHRQEKQEGSKKRVGWAVAIRFLNSHRFVPFAVGLKSIIDHDRTLRQGKNSTSFTIFAPREFEYMPLKPLMLDKLVKAQIVPGKYSYAKLLGLPNKALLQTLAPGRGLKVTRKKTGNGTAVVAVNRVQVTIPEAFVSKKFIIHGIPRAFNIEGYLKTPR